MVTWLGRSLGRCIVENKGTVFDFCHDGGYRGEKHGTNKSNKNRPDSEPSLASRGPELSAQESAPSGNVTIHQMWFVMMCWNI